MTVNEKQIFLPGQTVTYLGGRFGWRKGTKKINGVAKRGYTRKH